MWPQLQHEMVKVQLPKFTVSNFMMAGKRFGVELGSVTSLQPWSHTTAVEVEVSWFGEGDHHDREDRTQHLPGESHWAVLERQCHWALLLCPTPLGTGTLSSFKTTMQELIVHVLYKISCKSAESRLSHGQRGPQTCLLLAICRRFSGDVSGDALTSHRTSASSLVHSRRNGAGFPKQPLGGSSETWGVFVLRAWRRLEPQLAIETSVKFVYWPLKNSKSNSNHVTH